MHLHDAEAGCKLFFIPLELVLLQVQHLELCAVQEPAPEGELLRDGGVRAQLLGVPVGARAGVTAQRARLAAPRGETRGATD